VADRDGKGREEEKRSPPPREPVQADGFVTTGGCVFYGNERTNQYLHEVSGPTAVASWNGRSCFAPIQGSSSSPLSQASSRPRSSGTFAGRRQESLTVSNAPSDR
jgi:hypothetical protein